MRLNSALISIFLSVSAVLSNPLRKKGQPWFPSVMLESTNGASDGPYYYSPKFSGAFREETDGHLTFATATFNTIALSAGQHGYTSWVGIDSINTCNDSWLAVGIDTFVTDNSETSYTAWYEWGGDGPYYSDVTITPKDVIRASITALSATSGVFIIKNLNNGQTNVHYLNSTRPLCERDVTWGVAPYHNESIAFDTVTITNAMAYGPSGIIYDAEGANKACLKQDNKVVTSIETAGSTVTIQHVHE
ncbi:peptidase A4 family-domain-containing protein [Boletus reticuloceps]|uniref:Peptidase A4 family-domain-containing protein n=1 Tax=Boletus reticuloceps TaxID=495285 RepID=A0A8I2YVQ6_9AGAM|nr:peptidase A4 family-domain-containing protein [Boletus reticuloceps]